MDTLREWVREWMMSRKWDKIPRWWDFAADCGYSDKWYRCGKCDHCLQNGQKV